MVTCFPLRFWRHGRGASAAAADVVAATAKTATARRSNSTHRSLLHLNKLWRL